jgi:hypothetical protein
MRKLGASIALVLGLLVLFTVPVSAELVIDQNCQLVSSTRVGRTLIEYTYNVNITNNGSDAQDVTASVSSSSPYTVVVDGAVNFGDVPAGETVTGTDTFTIRQDRRYPFDPEALIWDIQSRIAANDFTQYYQGVQLLRDGNDIFEEINATTLATGRDVVTNCEETNHYDNNGEISYVSYVCTFSKNIIDEITGEIQVVPMNVNTFRWFEVFIDWQEMGGTQTFSVQDVVLASGRIVRPNEYPLNSNQTVRIDGTPFDFEGWYGEEVPITSTSFCEEYWSCDWEVTPTCTICWQDYWAVSSYNDPISEVRLNHFSSPVGGDWYDVHISGLDVAYGDSIDPYFPGRDNWWDDAKTVFVTRGTFTGDLGGFDGANAICNAEAQAAGLEGEFTALLSGIYEVLGYNSIGLPIVNPGATIPRDARYVLPDGTRVMKNLAEAEGSGLLSPINQDAYGQSVSGNVWTGTLADGVRANFVCSNDPIRLYDWTRSDILGGMTGNTAATDARWLEDQAIHCGQEAALYCFED